MTEQMNALFEESGLTSRHQRIDETRVHKELQQHFGLTGTLHPIDTEKDSTFRLRTQGGDYLVKVSPRDEPLPIVRCQTDVIDWVQRVDPSIPVQSVLRTHDGANHRVLHDSDGAYLGALRVLEFIPGTMLGEADATPQQLARVGAMLGKVDLALQGFEHEGLDRPLVWNISNFLVLEPLLNYETNPERRAMAEQIFALYSIPVAQTLLTRDDLRDRHRYLNARNALLACLLHGVLPIINENDVVAVDEIRVGDNDNLSALVANLVDADLLVILSDVDGLYTADPRREPGAALIPEVRAIDDAIYALAGGSSMRGTGGMQTKIQAADLATRGGAAVVIASGGAPNAILRVLAGEPIGTRFPPIASRLESRKRWVLAETVRHSRIVADAGAARALTEGGKSLLPAGVVAVEGDFERGQTARIYGGDGREIARGLAQYGARDLRLIKGLRSTQIAETLGYDYGPEVVHRDDMVLL